jgi:hypothetical protein
VALTGPGRARHMMPMFRAVSSFTTAGTLWRGRSSRYRQGPVGVIRLSSAACPTGPTV